MRFEHICNVKVSAVFSPERDFRYRLEVEKHNVPDGKTVCVVMQNPSVADEDQADKSVQFLEKLIFEKDYCPEFQNCSRLLVVNQYAYIQTKDFEGNNDLVGHDNDAHIKKALDEADIIVIAWGKNDYTDRKDTIKNMIRKYESKTLFKSKIHPSRSSYDDFMKPYAVGKS